MRLDLIYRVLLDNKVKLNRTNSASGLQVVSDLNRFRNSIDNIEKTGTFKGRVKLFKESVLYNVDSDSYELKKNELSILNDLSKFENDIKVFTDNLGYILPKEKKELVYVKLPELKEFDDLSEFAKDIKLLFSQLLINETVKGTVVFEGVESGSSWYKIYVGTSLALSLIGSAVWSATIIQKKMEEVNQLNEQTKTLKYKNDNLKSLTEANKTLLNTYLEIEAHKIADKTYKEYDNEQIERIKNSIKTLTELINKGVEVQPVLSAPEDIQQLFPGMENLGITGKELKKLNK